MKPPRGYVLPDFFNLGLAPPAPRGGTAVAPRVGFVPLFALGTAFTRIPRACEPLAYIAAYALPLGQAVRGLPFQPTTFTPLIPNPYAPRGSGT